MGLDMYLSVRKYVNRIDYNSVQSGGEPEIRQEFQNVVNVLDVENLIEKDSWTGMSVDVPVGYWRKANAIHAWIVNNCANGVDECQPIYVSPDKASELLKSCQDVVEYPEFAKELLPPQSGFFFGSTDVDEYYINDLKYTIQVLTKVLSAKNVDSVIYQASW